MPTANHGPSFPTVLYPVHRPRAAGRIKRAVSEVVARMKPISLCVCGEFCATDRKLRLNKKEKKDG